jgi:hypothetical protein
MATAVVITVAGPTHASLRIRRLSMVQAASEVDFQITVQNTGERFAYPQGTITLTGGQHHRSATLPVMGLKLLIAGATTTYHYSVPGHLSGGQYAIVAVLRDPTTGATATWKTARAVIPIPSAHH